MRTLLRALIVIAAGPALWAAGAAQEPTAVPLTTTRLSDPGLVLSPSCVDRASKERPIVCYCNYGTEIILPGRRLSFPPDQPRQTLKIGDVLCAFVRNGETISLEAGEQRSELSPAGLGFAPADVPRAGRVLAFPRGFFHGGAATLFCRSASAQAGSIEGERITLYDDNLDGQFTRGADGLCIGDPGNVAIFAPIGDLLPTRQGVYRIEQIAPDGTMLKLAPFAGKTGRLRVEMAAREGEAPAEPSKRKGEAPAEPSGLECRLAMASDDGKCSFAMLAGPRPIALPAGAYRVLYGLLYRPASKRVAALILPDESATVQVEADAEAALSVGEILVRNEAPADQVPSLPFAALLEIDLTAVELACQAGDFAKAQSQLSRILDKHPAGPNRAATKPWIDDLAERLEFENTPEAAGLRRAEDDVLAAVRRGDRAQAKAPLAQVRAAIEKVPAKLAGLRAFRFHKARAEALARFADGTSEPGLRATWFEWGFHKVTGKEIVANVDWSGSPGGGRTQFYGCHYEGFLVPSEEGEYELSLESDEGARMHLDGKQVIEHWGAHTLAEKTVRLRLTADPHPLKIEYFLALGVGALHLRWTPPGGRKAAVPAWAFEHRVPEPPLRAPE